MQLKNYYDILGIDNGASQAEIKLAYHRLARTHHPDTGNGSGVEELLCLFNEAYETLSDPEKRRAYDALLNVEPGGRGGFADDIHPRPSVESDEDSDPELSSSGGSPERRTSSRGHPSDVDSPNPKSPRAGAKSNGFFGKFKEGFKEVLGYEEVAPKKPRKSVESSSSGPDTRRTTNQQNVENALRGQRYYNLTIDTLESIFGAQREVALGDLTSPIKARVEIPPGAPTGTIITAQATNTLGGTTLVKVKLHLKSHPLVERSGNHIILKIPISIREAIEGSTLEIPTMDGCVRINLPPGWQPGRKLRIRGKGIVSPNGGCGDLFVKCHVVLPDISDDTVRKAAEAMEEFYSTDIRAAVPKTLRDLL